ncbi:MAG: ABC transporter ATP-binding protein [Thermoleophilia bacterium]
MAVATGAAEARAPMTEAAIEIRGLRKQYGRITALDDLNVTLPRAAVGLLGANGAGKTTLLRVLLGLTPPTRGSAHVLGRDTRTQSIQIRERVGFMPESDVLPSSTTAADFVGHMAQLSGLPARAARQRAADVLYQVGLDEERYRLIQGLSTGMKQRVKLAQAIVHDPDIVFLDEPTIGMDPQGRDDMLALIDRIYRGLGIAVVVSSHLLEDIERVCDYVMIIDAGKLVLAQPIGHKGTEPGDLRVRVTGNPDVFIQHLAAAGVQAAHAGLHEMTTSDELIVRLADERVYDIVRDTAADLGMGLRSLRTTARSLEDIYLGQVHATTGEYLEPNQTTEGPQHGA